MTIKISQKGWVVIPAKLRKKYNLHPGKDVHIVDYGGVLSFVPVDADPIEHAAGMLAGESSLVQALITEHAEEIASQN